MEREKLESLLIDYIDGRLNEADTKIVETELSQNEEAYELFGQLKEVMKSMDNVRPLTPSPALKKSFDAMLQQEIDATQKTKTVFFSPAFYRVAAAVALLIVGGGAGYWISVHQQQQDKIAGIQQRQTRQKTEMMSMLDNELSASQRVIGATVAYNMDKPDDEIITALVKAMNEDPNTNVRLAALDALGKFHEQPLVRKALIDALQTQTDPNVQIALIHLMVDIKEKEIIQELERITTDEEMLPAVKDEAHAGLLRLS
jgi:type I site-specific restriction-modification system R (restriction) subunit